MSIFAQPNTGKIEACFGTSSQPTRINLQSSQSDAAINLGSDIISSRNTETVITANTPLPRLISWDSDDAENPYNWSARRKVCVVIIGMVAVLNSTLGSSLPSNAIPYISSDFGITSPTIQILPMSMYLVGYIVGPLLFAPLSEKYGRRIIMVSTFVLFTIFTLACALAPNFKMLSIFRLITGIFASSPLSVTAGVYADMYADPISRGRAMSMIQGGTSVGPLVAPIISGYVSPSLGWRWSFWIGFIIAGASLIPLYFLPETFGPVLLAQQAKRLQNSTGICRKVAAADLNDKGWEKIGVGILTRPLQMLCLEPVVLATSVYLALIYGIFYMYFESYPVIFQQIYKLSPGAEGLTFLPIFAGTLLATIIFIYYDNVFRQAQLQGKAWTLKEESRRLPLACIGGPFLVVSLFWLGWTSRESVPFYIPMLAGIPFGLGFQLLFLALLNYLADAYGIFAASAMAASTCTRSLAATGLPFATNRLYHSLGVAWASSLLAFLSLGMCFVPFLFLWKGEALRARSTFGTSLKETN